MNSGLQHLTASNTCLLLHDPLIRASICLLHCCCALLHKNFSHEVKLRISSELHEFPKLGQKSKKKRNKISDLCCCVYPSSICCLSHTRNCLRQRAAPPKFPHTKNKIVRAYLYEFSTIFWGSTCI